MCVRGIERFTIIVWRRRGRRQTSLESTDRHRQRKKPMSNRFRYNWILYSTFSMTKTLLNHFIVRNDTNGSCIFSSYRIILVRRKFVGVSFLILSDIKLQGNTIIRPTAYATFNQLRIDTELINKIYNKRIH